MSAAHVVGFGFAVRPGHDKDHKMVYPSALIARRRYCRSLAVQPVRAKGRVLCETVYGDMPFKDISRKSSNVARSRISI